MINEKYVCERYDACGDVSITAQLNAIPVYVAKEILARHGKIVPEGPRVTKASKEKEEARKRKEIADTQSRIKDAEIKRLFEFGLQNYVIGLKVGLCANAVTGRLKKIYGKEQYIYLRDNRKAAP